MSSKFLSHGYRIFHNSCLKSTSFRTISVPKVAFFHQICAVQYFTAQFCFSKGKSSFQVCISGKLIEKRIQIYLQDTCYEEYRILHVRGVANYTLVAKTSHRKNGLGHRSRHFFLWFCNECVIGNSPHV